MACLLVEMALVFELIPFLMLLILVFAVEMACLLVEMALVFELTVLLMSLIPVSTFDRVFSLVEIFSPLDLIPSALAVTLATTASSLVSHTLSRWASSSFCSFMASSMLSRRSN